MLCWKRNLRRALGMPAFVLLAVGILGCQGSSTEEPASPGKTTKVIELDREPTRIPIRPSKPIDPLPRLIANIKARGGKVSADETGITAIDWHRAPIHNLDLELLTDTPSLKRLYLSGTRIDSRGWVYLSSLPNLERLALWRTPITDEDLKYLAGAKNLEVLDLSQTKITGSGLASLRPCEKLATLILRNSRCQSRHLTHIGELKSLRVLDLWGAPIENPAILQLKSLPRLEELRMYHNPGSLRYLAELPNIRKIHLPAAAFPHPMRNISHLSKMEKLETILAEGHGVRDEFFEHVARCPSLRELRVRGASRFTDAGLAHLKGCKTLRLLDVRDTQATAEGLRPLAQTNSDLRILVNPIEFCRLQSAFRSMDLGAKHSRDGGPRLRLDRELNIIALRLDDARIFLPSLKLIAKAIEPEKLEHLSLGQTELTDEGLANFRAGVNLKYLNLSHTKITTTGLKALGGGEYPELPYLETLDLSGTALDDDCLAWIATLDQLKTLRLTGAKGVTDAGWAKLKQLPNLKTLEK